MKIKGFVSAVASVLSMMVLGSGMCFADMEDILMEGMDIRFILNANPAAFLVSPDAEDFSVSSSTVREEIDGSGSWIPTLLGGFEFDTEYAVYAITAGGGYLYNDAFRAPLVQGDAAIRFKIWGIEIGPHAGVMYFIDPEWEGTADISLDESLGILGGISFTTTGETFRVFASADYVNGEFDVTGSSSWTPNTNEIDYSGFLGQIGVLIRF